MNFIYLYIIFFKLHLLFKLFLQRCDSAHNLIGSGIHYTSFKIECYHILLINDCSEYNFDFKLVNEKESILIYDLMLNDECVMKIKIYMEENYTSKNLEDVVLMLKNNIMIIRGGE